MVKRLEDIPGTISRGAWEIRINGNVLHDWLFANVFWSTQRQSEDHGYMEIKVAAPLGFVHKNMGVTSLFAALMRVEGPHDIQLRYVGVTDAGWEPPMLSLQAKATTYEFLPMQMVGAKLQGLDARSDMPVVQCITFEGRVHEDPWGLDSEPPG